MITTNKCFA